MESVGLVLSTRNPCVWCFMTIKHTKWSMTDHHLTSAYAYIISDDRSSSQMINWSVYDWSALTCVLFATFLYPHWWLWSPVIRFWWKPPIRRFPVAEMNRHDFKLRCGWNQLQAVEIAAAKGGDCRQQLVVMGGYITRSHVDNIGWS